MSRSSTTTPESICAICYLEMNVSTTGKCLLSCGHDFHLGCITQWFLSSSGSGIVSETCPTCRAEPSVFEKIQKKHGLQEHDHEFEQFESISSMSVATDDDVDDMEQEQGQEQEQEQGQEQGHGQTSDNYITGFTRLMKAISNNDLEKLQECLDNGDDIEARDSDGDTALVYALLHHNNEAVSRLIHAGANIYVLTGLLGLAQTPTPTPTPTPIQIQINQVLLVACLYDIPDLITEALNRGADPNYAHPRTGATPLMIAVNSRCSRKTIRLLISNGASVYCIDKNGWNVFMWLAKDSKLMSELLARVNPIIRPRRHSIDSARKIQALWRGYTCRKSFSGFLTISCLSGIGRSLENELIVV